MARLERESYGKVNLQTLIDIATKLDIALIVRFVSFPTFLEWTNDYSGKALAPRSYPKEVERQSAKKLPFRSPPRVDRPTQLFGVGSKGEFIEIVPPRGASHTSIFTASSNSQRGRWGRHSAAMITDNSPEAYGYTIFCDDIRAEVGGKLTYVGSYSGTMLVHGSFPTIVPKLALGIVYCRRPTHSSCQLRFGFSYQEMRRTSLPSSQKCHTKLQSILGKSSRRRWRLRRRL